jgi:hypothetical protein
MKALTYAFARLSKTGLGTFNYDAKSCFDRIMAALALIYCIALGMPDAPCQIHGQAISKMKHYAKTLQGTSQNYYSNALNGPVFGSGHGSGGSPSLWLFMWVALAAALRKIMVGMTFHSPDGTNKSERNQDAYVDNTTGGINDTQGIEPSTPAELAQRLHKLEQHWEKILFASGGRLELEKCFDYIICWQWTNGIASMMTNAELATNIALTCRNDATTTPIEHKEVTEAHRTLGTRMCPTGDMTAKANYLKNKAATIAGRIEVYQGPKWKAKLLYSSRYLPSMKYSLPLTTLSRKQVDQIQPRPTKAILSSLGINRMFQRAVAFGPPQYGGLGLQHLLTKHGTLQVALIIGHLQEPFIDNGKISLNNLDYAQITAGVLAPLLETPKTKYAHLINPWLDSHHVFLDECDAKIIITKAWRPMLLRHNNQLLMDAILTKGASTGETRLVNQCRLFLQFQRLSDIYNGAGTEICRDALSSTSSSTAYTKSSLSWPPQGAPSAKAWLTWRRVIQRTGFSHGHSGPTAIVQTTQTTGQLDNTAS